MPDIEDPRVYFAAERTLLAWIRTGLGVIGLGFVVARFGLFLRMMRDVPNAAPRAGSTWIGVGLVLCVLPGIYLAVGYTFALPLIIDKKYDFWTAMEVSRRVANRHWWTLFGLVLVLFLLNIIGLLACFVGWIVTAPLTVAAIQYAYEDVFGRR